MKKKLAMLLVTATQIFAEEESQEASSKLTSLKDSIMERWDGLSDTHKMVVYGLGILAVVYIAYRLFSCGAGGCGCGCSGNCTCHK